MSFTCRAVRFMAPLFLTDANTNVLSQDVLENVIRLVLLGILVAFLGSNDGEGVSQREAGSLDGPNRHPHVPDSAPVRQAVWGLCSSALRPSTTPEARR